MKLGDLQCIEGDPKVDKIFVSIATVISTDRNRTLIGRLV